MPTLTGSEYMAFMVSLNCIVAVTKMPSVAESDCPLERKSFTCLEATQLISHCRIVAEQKVVTAAVERLVSLKEINHLVSQKLVQVS